MKLIRPPYPLRRLYSSLVWRISTSDKKLFLTFDDGPVPDVTPLVLDCLKSAGAKATFFCVGENVEKHPDIYRRILDEGHAVGNHTYNHLNGWKTRKAAYFENIAKCTDVLYPGSSPLKGRVLFRPPYGRIRKSQIRGIAGPVIMWDVLSYDFDKTITPEKCLGNVLNKAREGSIVVFHDSIKAQRNMEFALPRVLDHFLGRGFVFEALGA